MKRTLSMLLLLLMLSVTLSGCKEDKGRIAYNNSLSDFEKSVKLTDYIGIKVDKKSAEFTKVYAMMIENDISTNNFIVKKTEGTVNKGDIIFIDYSAEKGGESINKAKGDNVKWTVGETSLFVSGCKIDGFDEALMGAPVGQQFDIKLKFPNSYPDNSLAGADVIFKIKVNYIDSDENMKPEEYYSKLGFKSYEDYVKNTENRAVKEYLLEYVIDNSKCKKYIKAEEKRLFKDFSGYYNSNSPEIQQLLEQAGETAEDFDGAVVNYLIHPIMDMQMPIYYLFDKEGLSYTVGELQNQTDKIASDLSKFNITKSDITNQYGSNYFEYMLVREKVGEFLYKNAKIV